ncbi:MAG: gluconeogenesis factor YvcK family protein [Plesiomonas sp.]|uniref:gluconeogenesis factor YvcK family protein n=1 Tax=Plesiomonas sp. TaxID=2486279 RepID=UPI003EE565D2
MRTPMLADLNHVVAIGGGHGLGRVLSSLGSLSHRLTGIVTTTDNGGSTGRIRMAEGGIAWGDTRNCINQLISEPTVASAMFEYRFTGEGDLAGHNLGNLMLKALDDLSVRPLDAINLVRRLLKVDAHIIPMSEHPVDLAAVCADGMSVFGEVNIDALTELPLSLELVPPVPATREAVTAIERADLILIGPGSFMTSLLPPLLNSEIAEAIRHANAAHVVYIGNLAKEHSPAATLNISEKLDIIERHIGRRCITGVVVSPHIDVSMLENRRIVQTTLEAADIPYRHDRQLLKQAIEQALR